MNDSNDSEELAAIHAGLHNRVRQFPIRKRGRWHRVLVGLIEAIEVGDDDLLGFVADLKRGSTTAWLPTARVLRDAGAPATGDLRGHVVGLTRIDSKVKLAGETSTYAQKPSQADAHEPTAPTHPSEKGP